MGGRNKTKTRHGSRSTSLKAMTQVVMYSLSELRDLLPHAVSAKLDISAIRLVNSYCPAAQSNLLLNDGNNTSHEVRYRLFS